MTIDEMIAVLQAAKKGKTIQEPTGMGWATCNGVLQSMIQGLQMRVKPEPRECWRVQFSDGRIGRTIYDSEDDAKSAAWFTRGEERPKPIRFREVIE